MICMYKSYSVTVTPEADKWKRFWKNVSSWREMNCSFSLLTFISLSTWTASCWWGPLIALISGEGYACSLTAVIARNLGYQDIQARFMSFAFWTEASSWAYLHSGGEPSKAAGLTNQWLYQQEWEQEASHSQQSFLCKCRASPSLAGCREIHTNVWAFQLLSPFLQQPPRWDAVAQRRIRRGLCKKTAPKYSCPNHLGTSHAAVDTQGGDRQVRCWQHCGSPGWSCRGSWAQPEPPRGSMETQNIHTGLPKALLHPFWPYLWELTDTIYIHHLL